MLNGDGATERRSDERNDKESRSEPQSEPEAEARGIFGVDGGNKEKRDEGTEGRRDEGNDKDEGVGIMRRFRAWTISREGWVMAKRTFRDLIAWRKGVELAKSVYHTTRTLPATERFGLMTQMRRAAVSVPSNIAEGNARESRKDYLHFLRIARGSLAELETQFVICQELQMLSNTQESMELLIEPTESSKA